MNELLAAPHHILFAVGMLFLLSVLANRLSDRLGVPALLVFLAVGMLAGSDGPGGIHFDNPAVANLVGVFALAYILFAGGMDTDWRSVRPVLRPALLLATLGVALTAGLVGLFAWRVLGFLLLDGLLLGAIVSSTDAAAVFSVLRSRGVALRGRLKPLLELESGSNDPLAVFLTVGILGLLSRPDAAWLPLLPAVLYNLLAGTAVGVAGGWLAARALNRLRLCYEGLYPVLSMSVVLLVYGSSELLRGNGFIAVYVCGIVLGNTDFPHQRYLTKFHDGLSWLMQIILFVTLGLLVFPHQLPAVAVPALLLALFLMLVARPVAVWLVLWRSGFAAAEKTLVAWTGLRGAVPIVLATYPFMAGYAHSALFFDIVFFVVLTSALLQGRTLMPVARWLRVDAPLAARPRSPLEFERRSGVQSETREIDLEPGMAAVGRSVAQLGLPRDVLILLIRRGTEFIVPRGHTVLEPYDTLQLLADRALLPAVIAQLEQPVPESVPAS